MKVNLKEILLFAILAVVACAVTLYRFNIEPRGLAVDEVEFAKAVEHLSTISYTPFTPLADGHPTVYFYILMLSTKLLGMSGFALRLPAALFGVMSVFLLYKILQKVFAKTYLLYLPLAFWVSLLFATVRWRFLFTRFAFEMPYLLFLELSSLYCMLNVTGHGPRATKKSIIFVILSAFFAGLAYNSYQPGRIFFLVPLLFLVLQRISWKKIALYLGVFIILILPMTVHLLQRPADDIRIGQQSYLMDRRVSLDKKISNFVSNISSTAMMFSVKGDLNGRHNYPGKPALNPVLSILFMAGLLIALLRYRDRFSLLFIAYFVVALIPTLLTSPNENPHMLRTYTVIPAVLYFVGVAVTTLLQNRFATRFKWIIVVLVLLFALSAAYDIRTYFVYQPSVNNHAFPMKGDLPGILKNEKSLQ